MNSLYPPGPQNVPADFTAPSSQYRFQVFCVLLSLFFTLFLYLALVALCAWAFYELATLPWPRRVDLGHLFVRGLGLFCSGLLFLYLFKGLFKRQDFERDDIIEITEQDQPDLFAFVRQLCADTGAPMPSRIYVSRPRPTLGCTWRISCSPRRRTASRNSRSVINFTCRCRTCTR